MKYIKWMLVAAAFTMAWSCSSSDENDNNDNGGLTGTSSFMASQQPQWQVDMNDNQQPPQWEAPDPSKYECKMIVMLRLQDELVPYSTDDDVMAVISNDECRALSKRDGNAQKVYFVINVHGNTSESGGNFRLCYYSGGLKQLFQLDTPQNTFFNERNVGIDNDFSPPLLDGATKYAVKTKVNVSFPLTNGDPILTENDQLAVFVDGECRGVGKAGQPFTVFTNSTGERGELRYYSQKRGGIFIAAKRLTLTGEPQSVTFEF